MIKRAVKGHRLTYVVIIVVVSAIAVLASILVWREYIQKEDSSLLRELFLQQEYEQLVLQAEKLPEQQQLTRETLYLKGLSYFAIGKKTGDRDAFGMAAESLELLMLLFPRFGQENIYSKEILGKAYTELGNYDRAKELLLQALQSPEPSDNIHSYLGRVYREFGEYDLMKEQLLLAEKSPQQYKFIASVYKQSGTIDQALRVIDEAISYFEQQEEIQAEFIIQKSILLEQLGRSGQAREVLERYVRSVTVPEGMQSMLYLRLGDVHSNLGNLVEARAAWRNSLALDPDNSEAQARLE